MRELIIVGAGGHGLETLWLAKRCGRTIKGFLDDTLEKQGKFFYGYPILGKIAERDTHMNCDFIIAIGSSKLRRAIIKKYFDSKEYNFTVLIDPSVIVGDNVKIGSGTMICAKSIITVAVSVGDHCIVNINSSLSHGVNLLDYVTLAPGVTLLGDVMIREECEIGAKAVVREKLIVNDGAIVGMGAVVTKNVEEKQVVVGNPAKLLKIIN